MHWSRKMNEKIKGNNKRRKRSMMKKRRNKKEYEKIDA
jgi:hypothetical protein